jgi:hypothetical protein
MGTNPWEVHVSASSTNKSDGQKAAASSAPDAGTTTPASGTVTAPEPGAAASTTPMSPPEPGAVTTPPGGPKADDAVPGTVVAQLAYNTKMIDALLDERAGYAASGRTERVKAVDKQLAAYGTTAAKATRERATRTEREANAEPGSDEKDRQRNKMIDALLDEREGYVRMDNKDRIAQVDESLKALGTTPAKAAKERAERVRDRTAAPDAQRAGGQQTR